MKNFEVVKEWIRADEERLEALQLASSLGLSDWCLAAGFVRNLIWDRLHEKYTITPLNDIDLIYFNAENTDESLDLDYERKLKTLSNLPWSVKNQARMHIRNDDKTYKSCSDAMRYWVEVETAVGASYCTEGDINIVAPFGLDANFSKTITLNKVRPKPNAFIDRVVKKNWCEIWPLLKVNS